MYPVKYEVLIATETPSDDSQYTDGLSLRNMKQGFTDEGTTVGIAALWVGLGLGFCSYPVVDPRQRLMI